MNRSYESAATTKATGRSSSIGLREDSGSRDRSGDRRQAVLQFAAQLSRQLDEGVGGGQAVPVAVPGEGDHPGRHAWAELDDGHAAVVRVDRERRNEREAGAGGDHAVDDVVLVQVVDVVRLEPAGTEVRVNLLEARAEPRRDQGQAGDLLERRRVGPGRELG